MRSSAPTVWPRHDLGRLHRTRSRDHHGGEHALAHGTGCGSALVGADEGPPQATACVRHRAGAAQLDCGPWPAATGGALALLTSRRERASREDRTRGASSSTFPIDGLFSVCRTSPVAGNTAPEHSSSDGVLLPPETGRLGRLVRAASDQTRGGPRLTLGDFLQARGSNGVCPGVEEENGVCPSRERERGGRKKWCVSGNRGDQAGTALRQKARAPRFRLSKCTNSSGVRSSVTKVAKVNPPMIERAIGM